MGSNSKTKNARKPAKKTLNFNEDDRTKYLLGFRKRKQERKQKAIKEIEEKIKQDKIRERELRLKGYLEEDQKSNVPITENKMVKREVIETDKNTIIVSDLGSMIENRNNRFSESEEEEDLETAQLKDGKVSKERAKALKESALIRDRIQKLEQRYRQLESPHSKSKAKKHKIKSSLKNNKSSKKFHVKDSKLKAKKRRMETP